MTEPVVVPPPTQVRHPWNAFRRTFVAVWIPGLVAFLALWPALEPVIRGYIDSFPQWLLRWVLPIITGLSGLAAFVSRLMAVPAVNAWLTRIRLGATPKEGTVIVNPPSAPDEPKPFTTGL